MKSLQLLLLFLFAISSYHVTGQNCTLSFDGETELCSNGSNTYLSTIPASIQSVEWQLDGQAISVEENPSISWETYGSGTFDLCLTTADSCNNDSVDPFCQTIIVSLPVRLDSTIVLCSGKFIDVLNPVTGRRDTAFSQTGIHELIHKDISGCDSVIITYDLTIEQLETEVYPFVSICAGEPYEIGDSTFYTSGQKQLFLRDQDGCLININFELEVRDSIKTIMPVFMCLEDAPFEIWDTTFNETGIFQKVYTAADGCDSTSIIDLVVFSLIDTLLVDTLCAEDVYPIGDTVFITSGTHVYTFENGSSQGCDSIVTIDLIIKEEIRENISLELCEGEILPIDQDIVTLDTIPDTDIVGVENVIGTAISVNGCDSTIYYEITINPTHYTQIDTTLCFDSSITIGGNVFFSNTTNIITLMNQYGCDSIVDYKVRSSATKPIEFTFKQTICPETDDLFIGDSLISETGHYEIILTSYLGCDSLVIADIIAHKEEDLTYIYEDVLCTGTTYDKIEGRFLTTGGVYMFDHLESASTGCDSIIILTLIENEGEKSNESVVEDICAGDFFVHPDFPKDTLRTESVHPLSKIFPETCENFDLEVTIIFKDSIHVSKSEILCDGDSIAVGTRFYKEEGIFVDTLQRSGPIGCDSIVTTTIQIRDCNIEIVEEVKPSACNGERTGSIQFEVVVGKPPFIYELALPENGIIETGMIDNLQEIIQFDSLTIGTYTLTIKDTVNAFKEFILEVEQPNEFNVNWNPSEHNQFNVACQGDEDGTLEVLAEGGTAPYDYTWSNGSITASLSDLSAGVYTVTITDEMDCEYIESFEMIQPDSLSPNITVDLPNCSDLSAGEIVVRSTDGGVAPYSYKMGGYDSFSTERRYGTLSPGKYTLVTMDDNGCISEFVAELPEPEIPELLFDPDIFIDLGEEVAIDIQATVPLVRTEWDGPEGLSCYDCEDPTIQPIDSKIFMVSVVSVDSCVTSKELTIHVNKKRDVFVPNIFSPNGDGLNDHLVIHGGPEVLSILNFEVYDRWGSKVFSRTNLAPNTEEGAWDGTFAGKRMRAGSFVWMAQISFIDGEVLEYYGDVVIK